MAIGLDPTKVNSHANLDTYTYTVTQAGIWKASIQAYLNAPSSLSVVINKNGTPVATSTAPTTPQINLQMSVNIPCAINDVITFVLTSGNSNDTIMNGARFLMTLVPQTLSS